MREAMKNSLRLKAGAFLTTAFGVILVSGITAGLTFAAETLPAGFKKGDLAPEPSADMIEAGKRVYFTKCVWCHGVDGAGDGPGADRLWPRPRNFNQGTFKIRHTASGELPLFDAKKPTPGQNDLFETVTHGLPGSAMPSWEGILTEEQRLQVLSFVTTELVKDRKFTDKQSESQTVLQLGDLKPIPATELMAVAMATRSISKTIGVFQYSQPIGTSVGTSEVAGKIPITSRTSSGRFRQESTVLRCLHSPTIPRLKSGGTLRILSTHSVNARQMGHLSRSIN
jgi:mono/diheme cytochrome c family protein